MEERTTKQVEFILAPRPVLEKKNIEIRGRSIYAPGGLSGLALDD